MDKNFEIMHGYSSVIIEKDGTKFSVEKGPDGDIWFNSVNGNVKLPIVFIQEIKKNGEVMLFLKI